MGIVIEKPSRLTNLLLICLILFIISLYFGSKVKYKPLLHQRVGVCRIITYNYGVKSTSDYVTYSYKYGNEKYTGRYHNTNCDFSEMLGKKIPIIFDSLNPSDAKVLMVPSDYRKAGMQFPDSMKWILAVCDTN
jgi:hypothetical protein